MRKLPYYGAFYTMLMENVVNEATNQMFYIIIGHKTRHAVFGILMSKIDIKIALLWN